MPRGRPSLRTALIVMGMVAVAAAYVRPLLALRAQGNATRFDDAYMFARYAHHVLSGDGIAWNAGSAPTYGLTSLPYVFLVAGGMVVVPLADGAVLALLSWTLGAVAIAILAITAIVHSRDRPLLVPLLALGCLLWIVSSRSFAFHAITGMDTMLSVVSTSLLAVAWLWTARWRGSVQAVALGACGYACYAIRPDTLIYAAALPLGLLLASRPPRRRDAVLAAALLAALIALDTALKLAVFGDWLPLSFYAKQTGFYEGYRGGWQWSQLGGVTAVLSALLPCLAILVCAVDRAQLRTAAAYLVPVVLTFAYFSQVVQIMGHFGRYYLPGVPLVFVATLLVLRDARLPSPPALRGLALRAAVAAAIVVTVPKLFNDSIRAQIRAYRADRTELRNKATTLAGPDYWRTVQSMAAVMDELPEGSIVAASEVGRIGAEAPHIEIIDLAGLHNPDIAYNGFHAERVLARRPDLIWVPHYDYARIVHDLEADSAFRRDYAYCPGLLEYGIAVRNDSPHADAIRKALADQSRRLYSPDAQ